MKSSHKLVVVLYGVFGAVFFLSGLGVIALAATRFIRGQGDWGPTAFLGLFGAVFSLVGAWVITHGNRSVKRSEAREKRIEENKDAPWALREDWAKGVIRCSSKATLIGAWGFALFWNLVSSPVLFAIREEVIDNENRVVLLALLFPIVGVVLLVWAIRLTLRYTKYGVSEFELRALPACPGGFLGGVIRVRTKLEPADGYHLKLTCIRRMVTGSGKNRSTTENVLWQEEHVIEREIDRVDYMSTAIPVSFALPAGARETTLENPSDRILWLLEVAADVFGIDYAARFEVPVFQTDLVKPLVEDYREGEDWATDYRRPEGERTDSAWGVADAAGSQVRIGSNFRGGKEFYFPPGRNVGAAMGLSTFTLVWTGIVWFIFEAGAPVFAVIFGLVDLLLLLGCASMWFGSTRTVIDGRSIIVKSSILGMGSTQTISAEEIDELTLKIGMQSGRTPYYDLVVAYGRGRKATLGSSIKHKREAERILEEMKRCLPQREEAHVSSDPVI